MHSNNIGSCHNFCNLIKYATGLGCILGFIFNSYVIFEQYIGGKTLLSSDLQPSPDGSLMAPGIVICSHRAFKTDHLTTNIADFKKNTMALSDFLTEAFFLTADHRSPHGNGVNRILNDKEKLKAIYSAQFGTCYFLNTRFQVSFIYV